MASSPSLSPAGRREISREARDAFPQMGVAAAVDQRVGTGRERGLTAPVRELKTRARIRLNGARRTGEAGAQADLKLRDCLQQVAREIGFLHWEHARQVLGGLAAPGDDLGAFWHAPRTAILLNEWFARRDEAEAAHRAQPHAFLLPYRRQFMLVQADFVRELGVDPRDAAWAATANDLVRGYGTPAWLALADCRLRAPRTSFEEIKVRTAKAAQAG